MRRFGTLAFVFLGAVLLFTLEPLVGRMLLPRFGGAFHVWTTALMFFQGALFAGYLYAHLVAERIGRWHLAVVALPLFVLPLSVGDDEPGIASAAAIVALLAQHVALPFVVLSTTAIVAQRWWARTAREPYGLYAISNAGSLGALLLYALVIEPFVGLEAQRWAWMIVYVAYAILAAIAWHTTRGSITSERAIERDPSPRPSTLLYWALLSAAPSAFSMAVTNLIALDAGNIPLVWVIPLAIYLGSFVVAFAPEKPGDPGGTRVPGFVRRLWPHIAAVGLFFFSGGDAGGGWIDVAVHLVTLAFVSLAAHGELHRARPASRHLTLYYLVIALGGWAGGAFVALLAPALFRGLYEYPIALVVLAITMMIGQRRALLAWLRSSPRGGLIASAALVLVIVLKIGQATLEQSSATETLVVRRSAYGLYRVTRTERGDGAVIDLVSGNTRHGRQREGDLTPLSYYHPQGPLGDALSLLTSPRRVAVIGLGVGAAAGHLDEHDQMRFFEIDPAVAELARQRFTYLAGTRAHVDVVVGDARVSLAREAREHVPRYDLLLVDAFAGDAIPTHLVTVEALRVYLSRLAQGGVLLLHVSNRYYDLRGVLAANAHVLHLEGAYVARVDHLARDQDPAQYVALARRGETIARLMAERGWQRLAPSPAAGAWTDDHVNVLEALIAGL